MKILQIYNSAPHYRESIFRLIDNTFDCDFIFGMNVGDIKQMDTSLFKGIVAKVHNKNVIGNFYWQKGVQQKLRDNYDAFIIVGDTRCLSVWLFSIRARLFYPQKKVYFWTHGWYGKESLLEKILKKVFFRLPNGGIFLYGNYAKELMIKEGFNGDKLFVIHNSLAYEKQLEIRQRLKPEEVYTKHFGNDYPNLFFIGRLTKVKHLDLVLKALKVLKAEGEQFNFTMVGGGEQQGELRLLTKELAIEDRVWFYGPCYEEEQLGALIYNADLCVSPGNVGLTAMHVMMFGTPVLTHDDFAYQMPEFEAIRDGVTGLFFHRDDVDSLVNSIKLWFASKQSLRENVRKDCFREIDTQWTPKFQLDVLKKALCETSTSD